MNWNELMEECCSAQGCATFHFPKTTATAGAKRLAQDLAGRRADIRKVAAAVQKAYEANPNGTKEQIRKQSVKFIAGGFIFFFIGSLILNKVMSIALSWFLDQLFNPEKDK
jgi:hypothetical protein